MEDRERGTGLKIFLKKKQSQFPGFVPIGDTPSQLLIP